MRKLPEWNLTSGLPAFNDFETKTMVEKVYLLYKKVNQLIGEYNNFTERVEEKLADHEAKYTQDQEVFTTSIRQEFQDFIDVVDLKLSERGE